MSPILVTLTSHSDSNFERSGFSFKENKPDHVDPNSNGCYYSVRKKEGRTLRFLADCIKTHGFHMIKCATNAIVVTPDESRVLLRHMVKFTKV